MRGRSLTSFGSLFISLFAASLATASAGIFTETAAVETSSPTTSTTVSQTIFLTPHPAGDPKALSGFLMAHPNIKLTLLFPPGYFDGPERKPTLKNFQLLHSSQQIEIGLTLDNQPMLPLIADLSTGGAVKWNIPFVWPEDVAAQIARGSASFQRRWGTLPSGFVPPYFALSETVLETLKRFRMNWVLTASNEIPGVRFHSSLAVITPPALPVWDSKDLRSWANEAASWTLTQPLVYLDASQQTDPLSEIKYLESLAKKRNANSAATLILAQDLVREFPDAQTLPKDSNLFRYDYSS